MKLRFVLAVAVAVVMTAACAKKSSKKSGGPDPKAACMAQVSPSAGAEIQAAQLASGQDEQWRLTSVDVFESIEGSGNSLYVGVRAVESKDGMVMSRLCGGGTPNFDGEFNFSVPNVIDGKEGAALSVLKMKMKVDPSTLRSYDSAVETITPRKMTFEPKQGASYKLTKIDENTFEIWATFPSDTGAKGQFSFRSTYRKFIPEGLRPRPDQRRREEAGRTPTPQPGKVVEQPKPDTGRTLELYQEAYQWAFSSQGLNLSQPRAMDFANKVTSKGQEAGAKYFRGYKEAYEFCFSSAGPNMSQPNAMKYAEAIASTLEPLQTLKTFKDAYNFAFGSSGLNLSQPKALQFACIQAGIVP
ncbi:MAG: hypothetical protein AB7F86_05625 [Bdellovibrionales bacterium]